MPKPNKEEFDLGSNLHGQPFKLVREARQGGGEGWSLQRQAVHQLDDSQRVDGLTMQQMVLIGQIAAERG